MRAAFEEKLAEFKVPKIDLVMVMRPLVDVPGHLAVLREMKKEGRVRYIGVHHLASQDLVHAPVRRARGDHAQRADRLRRHRLPVGDRRAEETILPLALERKIGFMAYFAFDRGRLFKRAGTTPLPEWAAEFDAKTWAQFFLKYVVSHPAVTVARTGTTKAAHMLDNIGGGIGRLPNAAMRKRMAELVDSFPGPDAAAPSSAAGRTVITQSKCNSEGNLAPGRAVCGHPRSLRGRVQARGGRDYRHRPPRRRRAVREGARPTLRRNPRRALGDALRFRRLTPSSSSSTPRER